MGFVDELFPTLISDGSTGGMIPSNVVGQQLRSQRRNRIVLHELPTWVFNVSYGLRQFTDPTEYQQGLDTLMHFVGAVGFESTFRYNHPLLCHTSENGSNASAAPELDVELVADDDTRLTYQLRYRFRYGTAVRYMPITRPVAGTVQMAVDETEIVTFTEGPMGKMILDSDPGAEAVVSAGCQFHFEVGFSGDPRAAIEFEMTRPLAGRVRNEILLYQEIVSVPHSEWYFPGGSKAHGLLTGNVMLSLGEGRYHTVIDNTGFKSFLPDADAESIGSGPDIIGVKNLGTATHEVCLQDESETVVAELGQDIGARFSLWRDDDMNSGWEGAKPKP